MKRVLTAVILIAAIFSTNAQTDKNIPSRQQVLSDEEIVAGLNSYIEQVRSDWKIPGMGVTLMKDGKVLLMKGYGVKDYATGEKEDKST